MIKPSMQRVISILVLVLIVLIAYFFYQPKSEVISDAPDHQNGTYIIEGRPVTLINGVAQEGGEAGTSILTTTRYFGNEATGDLNGDGKDDVVFLLTQDGGGSGTFYYAVAAIRTDGGYRGTNALLLGDRVAPQTTDIENGIIAVNYADRQPGDPMTASPSVGKTLYARVDAFELESIEVSGEGVQLLWGEVTYGGEVRTFKPCGATESLWVLGSSPAYAEIFAKVKTLSQNATSPYTPVFGALVGSVTPRPSDGFGMDYKNGFWATKLVTLVPGGRCR